MRDRTLDTTGSSGRREILIPLVFLALSLAGFGVLWKSVESSRNSRFELETRITAEQVRHRLEAWVDSRTAAVEILATRWNREFADDPEAFRRSAREVLDMYPGFQAINWIDDHWVIRAVVPSGPNRSALDQDLHRHPSRGVVTALRTASETGAMSRTPVVDLLQGGRGFTTYRPVHGPDGELTGFINGVFRIDTLVDACLAETDLRDHFRFEFLDENGRVAYQHSGNQEVAGLPYSIEGELRIVDRPWTMRFALAPGAVQGSFSSAARVILAAGLLLALALAVTLRGFLQRQRALRESEAKYKLLVENQTDLILRVTREDRITFASPSLCRTLGVEEKDLLQGRARIRIHPEDWPSCRAAMVSLAPERPVATVEARLRVGDDWHWYSWVLTGVVDDDSRVRAVVIAGRDITARRNLELRLLQSQKLQAIGRLAGGVAHDFNNLLQAILGYLELLSARGEDPQRNARNLEKMKQATLRAVELTRQLLAFGRRQDLQPTDVDLDRIVSDVLRLVNTMGGKDIVLRHESGKVQDRIRADVGQLEQVIVNLCQNAVEAMPQGGTLTLRTRTVPGTPREGAADADPGRWVVLEVSDTGAGMDADTQARIFEPFFTTRPAGAGSGLGLSTVLGIVEQHEGHVEVESEPGRGTTFRLFFPSRDARPQDAPAGSWNLRQGEAILVVREEDAGIPLLVGALNKAGYEVLRAPTADAAVGIVHSRRSDLRLVAVELTEDEAGLACTRRIRAIDPSVPILRVVGPGAETDSDEDEVLLARPFTGDALVYRVRTLLDETAERRRAG